MLTRKILLKAYRLLTAYDRHHLYPTEAPKEVSSVEDFDAYTPSMPAERRIQAKVRQGVLPEVPWED